MNLMQEQADENKSAAALFYALPLLKANLDLLVRMSTNKDVVPSDLITDFALAICHKNTHVTEVIYNTKLYRNQAGKLAGEL